MDDNFKEKAIAMYEYRQALGCPTMECKSLQDTILKECTDNTFGVCLMISTLLSVNNIEIDNKILEDMATILLKNNIKHSTKCVIASFELCQACGISKLIDSEDVQ